MDLIRIKKEIMRESADEVYIPSEYEWSIFKSKVKNELFYKTIININKTITIQSIKQDAYKMLLLIYISKDIVDNGGLIVYSCDDLRELEPKYQKADRLGLERCISESLHTRIDKNILKIICDSIENERRRINAGHEVIKKFNERKIISLLEDVLRSKVILDNEIRMNMVDITVNVLCNAYINILKELMKEIR